MSGLSSKFVTEEEVQEKRQQRQEEWDRVRQPDDPIECPEEETRSLFDQLQANKALLEQQAADEDRLKTSVKGLEDEEVQFLNYVSNRQMQIEKERACEEKAVIAELRSKSIVTVEDKTKAQTSSSSSTSTSLPISQSRKSQQALLSGAIKRKSTDSKKEVDDKKIKTNNDDSKLVAGLPPSNGVMQVAGILPGIGSYDDDSSTENSSASSDSEADHQVIPSNAVSMVMQELKKKWKQQQQQCQ